MKNITRHMKFWPALVLTVIAGQTATLVIVGAGATPFNVRNIGFEGADGIPRTQFAAGEIVGIRREVCADRDIAVEFFPSLRSENKGLLALATGAAYMRKECRQTLDLFTLPANLPQGRYQYENIVKYQSNLVGRDEETIYPPLELEVVSAR